MRVEIDQVSVHAQGSILVDEVSLTAPAGATVGLLGPNGSGKSTLLRAVYRAHRPTSGTVHIGGEDVWHLSAREAAHRTAVVLQEDRHEFEFSARETVELGRIPHRRTGRRTADTDDEAVSRAIDLCGIGGYAHRPLGSLSGGERQRVAVARAIAQDTPVLVMDEPTNHLDVLAQIELLELVSGLTTTTIVALHDLGLAAAYCDHVVVLDRGRVVAAGPPETVVTAALIAEVYGVIAEIGVNPLTERLAVHLGATIPRNTTSPAARSAARKEPRHP
ncbi:ABC transporter ATP-binding protein [Plantibacter cousiniae (nom. nud.)]|uniref:ABC transporter ATP-binding protein n=1 Tax=Plantibacter cousiniae (nom. nud.) TaxID=199709 RepID=UPI001D6C1126|nr:ABC transporter ATP-binding protein [Plantibacter cousiniae]CAH0242529.1 Fe(3+) dicitrate transport ATP-binding protein FecE [Plantibacter cousiniae]